jgi:hypothetical protein
VLAATSDIANPNGTPLKVDLAHLVPQPHIDPLRLAEGLGGTGDEALAVIHDATHEVRDPAGGVRGEVSPLEGNDLEILWSSPTARLRRGTHAGGVPADDNQSFTHGHSSYRFGHLAPKGRHRTMRRTWQWHELEEGEQGDADGRGRRPTKPVPHCAASTSAVPLS